ncbi:hypothetical protein ACFLZ8_05565 [Planctomycetota bacterium]
MHEQSGKTDIRVFLGLFLGLVVVIGLVAVLKLDVTGRKGSGLGADFEYNIEQLAQIDPNLIIYEETAEPINIGLSSTHAIAVNAENIFYVAGDSAVRVFDYSGSLLDEMELAEEPRCLAVVGEAGQENLYIGFKDHAEVYDSSGKSIARWDSLGEDAVLTSIAVWEDNIFVADAGNRIVLRYDTDGNIINRIGAKDEDRNISGFVIPSPYFDLTVGRDGLLWVVNPGVHLIEAYTFAGDRELSWGEFSNGIEGFCGCCNPVNFAILPGNDPTGANDSFVTCEKGLTRIKIYDPEGVLIGVVAGPEQLIEGGKVEICDTPEECQIGGFDITVDFEGRVLVLDTIKNLVKIFTRIEE